MDRLQALNDTGESQYLPRQNRDVTFVSRLQGLQAAVESQLEQLAADHASRRVALVAFSNEVSIDIQHWHLCANIHVHVSTVKFCYFKGKGLANAL